jgi:hypothetical protein
MVVGQAPLTKHPRSIERDRVQLGSLGFGKYRPSRRHNDAVTSDRETLG